ncbi:MAG: L,D-transpeptidase family protein [Myxococcaceae bacterium]
MRLAALVLAAGTGGFPGVYPADEEVIGAAQTHQVVADESLIEIARDYDLGYNAIAEANPSLDPFVPGTGTVVSVPTSWIVPRTGAPGTVVVNLSEMRLYFFAPPDRHGESWVLTLPIGIGSEGAETPLGRFQVIARERNPVWRVPPSILKEEPELPPVVPAGPDNPLGTHALRLSGPFILIHGTNKPFGVGRRVSHGCIRLYPEDIPWLYQVVPVGTEVLIEREPVKVGLQNGRVYVEVHSDEDAHADNATLARRLLADRDLLKRVSASKLREALKQQSGMPVDVTR